MSNKSNKKKYKPAGRPGGNPEIINWSYQPAVPGKPKNFNLTVKVDEEMLVNVKGLPNWADKVRAKLDELLQEEWASNSDSG